MNKNITIRKSQSVESFLQDASKHPLLTIDEEVMLAKRVQKGDEDAMNRLYEANLRFVISVAKQYQDRGLSMEELVVKKVWRWRARSSIQAGSSSLSPMQSGTSDKQSSKQ